MACHGLNGELDEGKKIIQEVIIAQKNLNVTDVTSDSSQHVSSEAEDEAAEEELSKHEHTDSKGEPIEGDKAVNTSGARKRKTKAKG
jgi:hypothetical protein